MNKYREFWERNLVSAAVIQKKVKIAVGSKEYFDYYDNVLRGFDKWAIETDWYNLNECINKKVLDIGCGNGWVSFQYAKNKASVIAFDISENAVHLSKKRFEYYDSPAKAKFLVCDAQDLPFKDGSFDLITCIGVLHNICDFKKAVGEISRVCKRNGKIYAMVFYKSSFFYKAIIPLIALLRGKLTQDVLNSYDGNGNPLTRVFSKKEIQDAFSKYGIKIKDMLLRYLPKEHFPLPENKSFSLVRNILAVKIGFYLYIRGIKE